MTTPNLKRLGLVGLIVIIMLLAISGLSLLNNSTAAPPVSPSRSAPSATATPLLFDGASAMRFAQAQCDIGPRPPGTTADVKTGDFIIQSLPKGWTVEQQRFEFQSTPIRNIIAKRGQGGLIVI